MTAWFTGPCVGRHGAYAAFFDIAINRRVLGSMNQLAHDASWVAGRYSDPLALALHLSNMPMSALGAKKGDYGYPDKVTRQLMQLHLPAKGAGH